MALHITARYITLKHVTIKLREAESFVVANSRSANRETLQLLCIP